MCFLKVDQKFRSGLSCALICTLLLVCLFLAPSSVVLANEENHIDDIHREWQRLNELAKEVLSLVEKKEYTTARNHVQQMAAYFMDLQTGKYVEHAEQAHILLESILKAKEALTETEVDEKKVQRKVLKMRLALNAVSHPEQPLWLQYYSPIEKIVLELQHSLKEGERDQFFGHLNRLSVHYELVRPAIVVSHPLHVYTQLDSRMTYFFNNRSQLWQDREDTEKLLGSLLHQIRISFFLEKQEQQSFWLLMVGLGTIICGILFYVGWRKYQGERARQTVSWRDFNSP